MEADLAGAMKEDKALADQAIGTAVRLPCIRPLARNAGVLARCLFARLTAGRFIVPIVFKAREKPGETGVKIDFRGGILAPIKLLPSLIFRAMPARAVIMN